MYAQLTPSDANVLREALAHYVDHIDETYISDEADHWSAEREHACALSLRLRKLADA